MPSLLGAFGLLYRPVDLTAVDRHFFGSIDPQSHFVAPHLDHGDDDIVTDDNAFVFLAGRAGFMFRAEVARSSQAVGIAGGRVEVELAVGLTYRGRVDAASVRRIAS